MKLEWWTTTILLLQAIIQLTLTYDTIRAVQSELFTARVLCHASYWALGYSTDTKCSCELTNAVYARLYISLLSMFVIVVISVLCQDIVVNILRRQTLVSRSSSELYILWTYFYCALVHSAVLLCYCGIVVLSNGGTYCRVFCVSKLHEMLFVLRAIISTRHCALLSLYGLLPQIPQMCVCVRGMCVFPLLRNARYVRTFDWNARYVPHFWEKCQACPHFSIRL